MKAATLQRALPVVAGMIADRTGIEVKTAAGACTDGKVIYLPALPLDLKEDDFVTAIGYIYHEAGHILDTDFSVPLGVGLERAIINSLEDIRIEKQRMIRSPGARRYLGRLVEILTQRGLDGRNDGFWPVPADDSVPASAVFQAFLLYKLRHEVLGQEGIKPLVDTAEAAMARFPKAMRTRLEALMFEVEQCANTGDVSELAHEIIRMIKEEQEKEQEQEEQQQQQQQQQDNQSADSSDDDDGQSGADSSAQDDSSTDDGGQSGAGDDDGGDSQDGAQQQSAEGGQGESGESADAGQPQDDAVSDQAGNGAGGSNMLKELLAMSDDDVMETLDDMLENSLNQAANQAARSGRVVSTANVHPLRLPNKQADTSRIKSAINAIRVRTMAWLSSAAECDTQVVHAGKQLDYTRLHQARFGGPVFMRVEEGIDLNADISILVDRSGSMTSRIQLAAESALATLLAYDIPGINTQVAAFPVSGVVNGNADDDGVAVVKRWNESPRFLGGRVQSLTADGSTPMAEAILWATCDLLRRDEALRILLVVTDGDPDEVETTREVIDLARKSGVQVLGLGIGSDTKGLFGDKHAAVIGDIKELTGSMIKLIKQAMSQ
jgi:cobalamin biosynthesis protein CobT